MKNWVPDKHCRSMVYKQYYYPYTYDREPYYESKMVSCYDQKYDPDAYKLQYPEMIKLNNETLIEKFGENNNISFLLLFLIIIIIIFLSK